MKAAVIATTISTCSFLCFQLFPRQIIRIFGSGSEEYYHFAEQYFRIFLFFTFLNGIQPSRPTSSLHRKGEKGYLYLPDPAVLFLLR